MYDTIFQRESKLYYLLFIYNTKWNVVYKIEPGIVIVHYLIT